MILRLISVLILCMVVFTMGFQIYEYADSAALIKGVRYANNFPGADIGAKVNAAFASFGAAPLCGPVKITPGSYPFTTTIDTSARSGCRLQGSGANSDVTPYPGTGITDLIWQGTSATTIVAIDDGYKSANGGLSHNEFSDFRLICDLGASCKGTGIRTTNNWFVYLHDLYLGGWGHDDHEGTDANAAIKLVGDDPSAISNVGQLITIKRTVIQESWNALLVVGSVGLLELTDNNRFQSNYVNLRGIQAYLNYGNVIGNDFEGAVNSCVEWNGYFVSTTFERNHFEFCGGTPFHQTAYYGANSTLTLKDNGFSGSGITHCVDLGTTASSATIVENNTCVGATDYGYKFNIVRGAVGPNVGVQTIDPSTGANKAIRFQDANGVVHFITETAYGHLPQVAIGPLGITPVGQLTIQNNTNDGSGDLFTGADSDGVVIADLDSNGIFDAAGYKQGGAALASTHLSNSSAIPLWVSVPATATDACTAGQMARATGFLYVCVATDSWERAVIAAW